jgi:hypothetical protein
LQFIAGYNLFKKQNTIDMIFYIKNQSVNKKIYVNIKLNKSITIYINKRKKSLTITKKIKKIER